MKYKFRLVLYMIAPDVWIILRNDTEINQADTRPVLVILRCVPPPPRS
jgi:hypothetical protein